MLILRQAVATRLSVSESSRFWLDTERAAVGLKLRLPAATVRDDDDDDNTSDIWVYGTHLEACDGDQGEDRLVEMENLLKRIESDTTTSKDAAVIVAGDFNQQRQMDYTEAEWAAICANKESRYSPKDDGVAAALNQAGFTCTLDSSSLQLQNWDKKDPPPSTHWTGTIVDYSYSRNLDAYSVYVSPSDLSDHRLIITDWSPFGGLS